MQLVSPRTVTTLCGSAIVAASLVACGGTVVFEEDGGSDGGGGPATQVGPTGSTSSGQSGGGGFTTSSGPTTTTSGNPTTTVGPGPGPDVSSASGGPDCSGQLFTDPDVDECSRSSCCFEMGTCLNDPFSCFDDSGQLDTSLPNGRAFFECVMFAGCLPPTICDSGIEFGSSDPETVELAICLSDNCCEEFHVCTDFSSDIKACIDCLDGLSDDPDLCRPAIECGSANCNFAVDT